MRYRDFWRRLTDIYDEREAKDIASLVFEKRFGLSLTDVCMGYDERMSDDDNTAMDTALERLLRHEPVQYVLGGSYFRQSWYVVRPGILIPRPETEALVEWVTRGIKEMERGLPGGAVTEDFSLLDCCCGSGCIALELKNMFPRMQVSAYDISDVAIEVSMENARRLGREINVFRMDALNPPQANVKYDIMVSNPPYVCESEKAGMRPNVLEYEPSTALFVPDDDPLRFYRAIASYACSVLSPGGLLYFEINPLFVKDMRAMLAEMGYSRIEVNEDLGSVSRLMRAALDLADMNIKTR